MEYSITVDQSYVREMNLSSVLQLIYGQNRLSRAQLANLTNLNKSTVSSLVEDLIHRGLIYETGLNSAGTGRPATILEINPDAGGIIGLELGVDFISVILTDFLGKILWRRIETIDPNISEQRGIDLSISLIADTIHNCSMRNMRLLGIGVSTPGIVDLKEKVLVFAPNLHWRNVSLGKIVTEHTGLPAFIDNDGNSAALGEHLFGKARSTRNFVFIFAGVGIGAGLFLNNELYRGQSGFAGEIGHTPILMNPTLQIPCHCGNRGCWETHANQYSIIHRAQACLEAKRETLIRDFMQQDEAPLSISLIKRAADSGDQEAIDIFLETGEVMGLGIATLINIFNPEKVILGGPLSIIGDYLLPAISASVKKHTLSEIYQQVEILISEFGPDASVIGAVALVVNNILINPSRVEEEVAISS
jgi:glucokinase-like ROK family protein